MSVNWTNPAHADIHAIRKRFEILNRDRLGRARSTLRERQRDVFDVLPLLFHTNHPSLPGFVSKNTPCGVSEYRPPDHALEAAGRIAKTFQQKRRALFRYEILGLYLMGSSGTIAYSKKSDFDIWICHRHDIDLQGLGELRQKAQLIEKWAAELDLEVHFFLVEPTTFSQGIHEDMSAESSGSAQHYLLMEEFYRTGLLLAGRYPLWWLVPPEHEKNYDAFTKMLRDRRFVSESECIDFGAMEGVPAEEFFGAALWQLYKGIDSPYKSVLKLLLMEVYAKEYPSTDLLCHRFKRRIFEGETSLDQLDPYLMLYQKIEDYLKQRGETERLELVRRCFYFKIAEPLSVPDKSRGENWRRELLSSITQSWAWSIEYLQMLDSRAKWKVDRVMRERSVLVKALTYSYQFLSDFAREHAQLALINERDMTILGRKLYAAFERKAGKVEIINRGISNELWEPHVSFYRTVDQEQRETWLLYAAPLNVNELRKEKPLRRSASLIELLAWCYFNNMIENNTVLAMHSQDTSVTTRELREMLFSFQRLLPTDTLLHTQMEDFVQPRRALQVAAFINLGVDPLADQARSGHYVLSERTDALNYGGLGENLAISFDIIVVTSWKEVLTSRYIGVDGMMEALRDYLRWVPVGQDGAVPQLSAHCYSYGRGVAIRQRIEELFQDVVACFHGREDGARARYVLSIEQRHYMLSMESGALVTQGVKSFAEIMRLLGTPQPEFRPIVFDRYLSANTVLPLISQVNRPEVVQVFFQMIGSDADVYVLDERGTLFTQRMRQLDRSAVIRHFTRFFDSIRQRSTFEAGGDSELPQHEIEFYEVLQRPQDRKNYLVRRESLPRRGTMQGMNIQVIGDVSEANQSFAIYCDDQEFSVMEFGNEVFRHVARYVVGHRGSGEHYPIYITDLDLTGVAPGEPGDSSVQTAVLLNMKKTIEKQLNVALEDEYALAVSATAQSARDQTGQLGE